MDIITKAARPVSADWTARRLLSWLRLEQEGYENIAAAHERSQEKAVAAAFAGVCRCLADDLEAALAKEEPRRQNGVRLDLSAIEAALDDYEGNTPAPLAAGARRALEQVRRDLPIVDAARAWGKALVEKRWRDAITALDVLFGTLCHGSIMTKPSQTIEALEKAEAQLREITAERDHLRRREQDIIAATDPADGGQYRNDIVSAIQRQRRDLDKAREEARLWKELAQARGWYIAGSQGEREAATMAECKAIDKLHRAGIDPDAPEQGR